MPVIWASPASSKLAPTLSVSVPPPPASSVSFWAPATVSLPPPAVMLSMPAEPVMVKPSVWLDRSSVTAAVSSTFSIVAIWASPVSSKLAPTCNVSVLLPPASSVSFCAPLMMSLPSPALMLSAAEPPVIVSAPVEPVIVNTSVC